MNPSPGGLVLVGLVVLAGLGAIAAFRSGARGAYHVARQTQEVTRMGGTLARALGTAVVIVAVQWAVVTFTSDPATLTRSCCPVLISRSRTPRRTRRSRRG